MKLPSFIFFDPQGPLTGAGFIICTTSPFAIGKVYKFKNKEDTQNFKGELVEGYNIGIVYFASLARAWHDEKETIKAMAHYYLKNKIEPNAAYYKKYQ